MLNIPKLMKRLSAHKLQLLICFFIGIAVTIAFGGVTGSFSDDNGGDDDDDDSPPSGGGFGNFKYYLNSDDDEPVSADNSELQTFFENVSDPNDNQPSSLEVMRELSKDTFNDYIMTKLQCESGWMSEKNVQDLDNNSIVNHMIIKSSDPTNPDSPDISHDAIECIPCDTSREPCSINIYLDKIEGCDKRYCKFDTINHDEFTITSDISDPPDPPSGSNPHIGMDQLLEDNNILLKYWEDDHPGPSQYCLFGPNCPESKKTMTMNSLTNTNIQCND